MKAGEVGLKGVVGQWQKMYYLQNSERIKERHRKYREANKLRIREKNKMYRENNRDNIKEALKRYYTNNNHIIKERARQYREENRDYFKEKLKKYREEKGEEVRDAWRKYYEKNKGDIRERNKLYYSNNREAIRGRFKIYLLENREKRKEAQKKYRENNKEVIKEFQKRYRDNNKNIIKERMKRYYLKRKKPRKYKDWTDPNTVRLFFESAGVQLYVRDPEDWYRISRGQMNKVGGNSIYAIFGNLGKALQYAFPGVDWDQSKFSFRGKKARQRWLKVILQQILPEETLIMEDYLHPQLFWDEKARYKMELDIWVPSYQLALEYQGEHHYHDLHFAYGPTGTLSLYSSRDLKKKETCSNQGITLVTIPYWWDGKKESLASTLFQACPDIFPRSPFPQIPGSPPKILIGHPSLNMNPISSMLMHGQVWNKQDPTGWIISEKLDGFRAFWDGSKLFSKTGQVLQVPLEFTETFPHNVCLDGELWSGYNDFNRLSSIMRKSGSNSEVLELWKDIKFCVFDAPMHTGTYIERHAFIRDTITLSAPYISYVPILTCQGSDHLQTILHQTIQKKGEGIMLYHPSSKYTPGRTTNLLKVKAFEEEDVKFVAVNSNSYSFLCEQKDGLQCVVKCSGWDYSFPPAAGTVLTVKHNGFFHSSQKMKYPFLLRTHSDLHWGTLKGTE